MKSSARVDELQRLLEVIREIDMVGEKPEALVKLVAAANHNGVYVHLPRCYQTEERWTAR
jgi:hypothetical protein